MTGGAPAGVQIEGGADHSVGPAAASAADGQGAEGRPTWLRRSLPSLLQHKAKSPTSRRERRSHREAVSWAMSRVYVAWRPRRGFDVR